MKSYDVCLSLSDLHHFVWQPLGPSMLLHLFLKLENQVIRIQVRSLDLEVSEWYFPTTWAKEKVTKKAMWIACAEKAEVKGKRAWGETIRGQSVWTTLCKESRDGAGTKGTVLVVSELPHWSPPQLCKAHEPCFFKEKILRDPGNDAQRQERPKEALVTSALPLFFLLGVGGEEREAAFVGTAIAGDSPGMTEWALEKVGSAWIGWKEVLESPQLSSCFGQLFFFLRLFH